MQSRWHFYASLMHPYDDAVLYLHLAGQPPLLTDGHQR
jgi:hypothetical protein